jgi:hypothetical protein
VEKDSRVPATLLHRFHLLAGGPPGSPKDQTVEQTYTVAPIAVSTDVTALGPPLSGKGWAAFNGCCGPGGAHRSTGLPINGRVHYAQRFAIDWMLLNHDAKFFHGDGKNVNDYADYGASVIAVADSTVVETLSTLDEQVPGQLPDPKTINIENVDGNHIVLDLVMANMRSMLIFRKIRCSCPKVITSSGARLLLCWATPATLRLRIYIFISWTAFRCLAPPDCLT